MTPQSSSTTGPRLLVGAALVLCALPFYVSVVPPMTDVSQHVLVARILSAYGDPAFHFPDYFGIEWHMSPGALCYVLLAGLQKLATPFGAARAYLTLFVVATYAAIWSLAKVTGHAEPRVPALVSLPLAFCWYVYMGLLPFLMTIPLFALAMAVWFGAWRARFKVPTLWVLLAALFGLHVVGAAAAAAAIAVAASSEFVMRRRDARRLLWAGLSVAPVPLLVGVYVLGKNAPAPKPQYAGLVSNAVDVIRYTCTSLDDRASVLMLLWLGFLGVVLIVRRRALVAQLPAVLAAATLVVLAVVIPSNLGSLWPAGPRLFPFALVLLIVSVPWTRFARWALPGMGLALLGGLCAFTVQHAMALDGPFRDFLGPASSVQQGKRVLPILADPHEGSRWVDPFWSLASAYTVMRGGSNPYVFATPYVKTGASPLRYLSPETDLRYAFLYDRNRGPEDYRGVSAVYDYVLLWGDSPAIAEVLGAEMTVVRRQGKATLFARTERSRHDRAADPPSGRTSVTMGAQ